MESESQVATGLATVDKKISCVEVTPQQFSFFYKFEHEEDVFRHNIVIMNTTLQPVILTGT